ncbi:MAG: hypothetical protein IPO86_12805 [Saprospiraceae bacterium]|nr:hypothetical protein [Saprospiraceae bacterium]
MKAILKLAYIHDSVFSIIILTIQGVKSACNDKWRQLLTEARRISDKHLFTLHPSISGNPTNEMRANSLLLVLPRQLEETYTHN